MKKELVDRRGILTLIYIDGDQARMEEIAGHKALLCCEFFPITLLTRQEMRPVKREELPLYLDREYKSAEFLDLFK
jgi:hypothetical protein